MPTPIIFTLTNAGLNAALDADANGLTLSLTQIGIGSGKYTPAATRTALQTEIARYPLSGGDVESNSKTLRFSAILESVTTQQAFEVGLFTSTGVLFAVASTTGTDPLILVTANIAFVGSFGLVVSEIPPGSVTVVTDPNAPLAVVLLNQHVTNPNPHPQYAMKLAFDNHVTQNALEHANLLTLIMAEADARDLADQQHVEAANPHPQYAFAADINPRHLFRFIHNTGGPYDTSFGVAPGSVVHTLEGTAHDLGDCLTDYDAIEVVAVTDYEVQGITLGNSLNRQGFLLKFDGYIQFGNYAEQGDTGFSTPSVKLLLLDDAAQTLVEIPLTLTHVSGLFANNGNVGHVMYRLSKDFDLYNLRKTNGQLPNPLYAAISATGVSDSDGGSPDLQILTIEGFSVLCSY